MSTVSLDRARAAKESAVNRLRGKADLVGVGISRVNGDYVVKVNLRRRPHAQLPAEIDGVRVVYEDVGDPSAFW